MMMTKSTDRTRQDAREALEQAKRQREQLDEQASQVAEAAGRLGDLLLDKDHLAPRMRKAMRMRFGG